ncbi:hypothetical protein TWF718_002743 [Orbilia javanica]|uniref:Transmembrane protein 135 N-terminal domain-containing protein n=1 Tax=Orbilia javanica TaxID=47235 RepID=A0AAN8RBX9_9PEZI
MRQLVDYLISPEELQALEVFSKRHSIRNRHKESSTGTKKDPGCTVAARRDNELKASIRLSGRIFLTGSIALTTIDRLRLRLHRSNKPRIWTGLGVRIPLSLSVLLLLHRIFHYAVVRLQSKLLQSQERVLPRILHALRKALLSPIAPSSAAALSGIALASIPSEDARLTISIYVFTKTIEYLSNTFRVSDRTPWWFGSWTLFPFALAQLFQGLLNGEGDIPFVYRRALMTFPMSNTGKTQGYSMVARMADVARLRFPPFQSSILFPRKEPANAGVASVFREAHPAIRHLSCAISHPKSVSCSGAWASYCLRQFWKNSQVFFALYSILFLSKLGSFRGTILEAISKLVYKTIRTSTFTTSAVATSWSTLCLCQRIFPKKFLGPQVFYVSGFLGGLLAIVDRTQSHPLFIDATRSALLSWWRKRRRSRYLRNIPSPEVLLFMASIATLNILYDFKPKSITSKGARDFIGLLRAQPESLPIAADRGNQRELVPK